MIALSKLLLLGGAAAALSYGGSYQVKSNSVQLRHFSSSEFRQWWPLMNDDLVLKLDEWTDRFKKQVPGLIVIVSDRSGAIGRVIKGDNEQGFGSWHNVTKHGQVRAIDVKPRVVQGGVSRALNRNEFLIGEQLAHQVGFTGIGIYPQWQVPGYHLDNRDTATPGNATTWGGLLDENGKQFLVKRDVAFRGFPV